MLRFQRMGHLVIWLLLAPVILAGLTVSLSDQLGLDLDGGIAMVSNFEIPIDFDPRTLFQNETE